MRIFHIILLIIFAVGLIVAVLIFSGIFSGGRSGGDQAAAVTVWGTIPKSRMDNFTRVFNQEFRNRFTVNYVFVPAGEFSARYLEALARDTHPDLIFFTDEMFVPLADTIFPVPLENFSARDFRDTFIGGSEIFLTDRGVLAMPVAVDPLVLYVNKDLYTDAGLPLTPRAWTDLIQILPNLNDIDERGNVRQSAIAIGEFSNNRRAGPILEMLILQAGNPIAAGAPGNFRSVMKESFGSTLNPTVAALNFFTQMADQSKSTYSWNRSLPEAADTFAAGRLANYLGFSSDLSLLRSKNPNINLDVAVAPQRSVGSGQLTLGRQIGLAVVRKSRQASQAFELAFILSARTEARKLAEAIGLPPARRDLLAETKTDAFLPVFYASALISRTWPDPDPQASEAIFKNMAEAALLKRATAEKAVTDASEQLDDLFRLR